LRIDWKLVEEIIVEEIDVGEFAWELRGDDAKSL
jgi:hypothetical protein